VVNNNKKMQKEESDREKARTELQRYMFYFERYENHEKSSKFAQKLLPQLKQKIELLHEIKSYPMGELTFLEEACKECIRCHNVLKWTYVYGYYCIDEKNKIRKESFEYSQTDLERFCDTLHKMVETPLDAYLDPNIIDRSPFYKFKGTLVSYFEATKKYYKSLVKFIQES
jgi:ariadne-1